MKQTGRVESPSTVLLPVSPIPLAPAARESRPGPVPLTVATASVNGLTSLAGLGKVAQVRLKAGQALRLDYYYTTAIAGPRKRECFFTLSCEAGRLFSPETPVRAKPVIARVDGPRWSLRRSKSGRLGQAFRFDQAGNYTLRFEVEAEEVKQAGQAAPLVERVARKTGGLIQVQVEP